ncbi:MAG: redoxin domain-containing protein [Ignavibacteriae bacterium]|nr:redoxin domain-containing protein [Ignavibacteriota bacterium]
MLKDNGIFCISTPKTIPVVAPINDHDLNFSLISDEDKSICEKYGVWVQKSMYGRSYMGVERSTFIIDPDGKIKQIYAKVKVPGHVEEVTNWLKDNIKA